MRQYTIARTNGAPDWARVEPLSIDCRLWCPPVDIAACARLAWDDECLYVRLEAKEKHIRAEHTGLLDQPCEDSCLEFFFSPAPGDSRYFNIELNPNCCMYLGLGDGAELTRLLPERSWFEPSAERTAEGWRVTYRVPHAFVRQFFPGYCPKPGMTIAANCFKCGDLTEVEHYFSWNPVDHPTPSFHRPQDFGRMTFGG